MLSFSPALILIRFAARQKLVYVLRKDIIVLEMRIRLEITAQQDPRRLSPGIIFATRGSANTHIRFSGRYPKRAPKRTEMLLNESLSDTNIIYRDKTSPTFEW